MRRFFTTLILLLWTLPAFAQIPMTGAGKGAPGGGVSPVIWTATDNPVGQSAPGTSATFTAANIGTASSDRIVVVAVNTTNVVATAVTVGGISATKAVQEATILSGLQIWYAAVSSGTTANIIVSAGGSFGEVTIQVGKLTGATATPTATNTATPGVADPSSITITVPTNGVALAVFASDIVVTPSISNATLDYNTTNPGSGSQILVHTTTVGSQTPTFSSLSGANSHLVAAAWVP